MTAARHRRRMHRLAPRARRHAVLEPGRPATIDSWVGVGMAVQLPVAHLAAGRLPALVVGDAADLVPVIWMASYEPLARTVGDLGDWWSGPAGTVVTRGNLVPPEEAAGQVYLLEVGGRRFPLRWTDTEPFASPCIEASGGLYLEPGLDPDGPLGPTGDHCRAPFDIVGMRRYTVTDHVPHDPEPLDRSPDPWDVDPWCAYVADLVECLP